MKQEAPGEWKASKKRTLWEPRDTESGAKELGLVAMPPSYHGQKALFPGPLGRGAPEILRSHCGQTKNRTRRSWLVREGCGDTTWLGQSCRP